VSLNNTCQYHPDVSTNFRACRGEGLQKLTTFYSSSFSTIPAISSTTTAINEPGTTDQMAQLRNILAGMSSGTPLAASMDTTPRSFISSSHRGLILPLASLRFQP
jgi:hypothetical protein